MTTLAEDFRTYLLSKATITAVVSTRIHHNHVPEGTARPHICYFRRQTLVERGLNETNPEPTMASFDVEIVDTSLSVADALADTVRAAIDGQSGTFGAQSVQGIFVDDHDEDYIPKVNDSDDVQHIPSFVVEIYP